MKYKGASPTKSLLQGRIAEKLINVFRSESLGRLAQRKQGGSGDQGAVITLSQFYFCLRKPLSGY